MRIRASLRSVLERSLAEFEARRKSSGSGRFLGPEDLLKRPILSHCLTRHFPDARYFFTLVVTGLGSPDCFANFACTSVTCRVIGGSAFLYIAMKRS